jgi:hypothetical protein
MLFVVGGNVWANNCTSLGLSLYGDVTFKQGDKSETHYAEFPSVWTVNADKFRSLYIKNEKKIDVDKVYFKVSSKDFNKEYTLDIGENVKKNIFKIKKSDFFKMLLPSYRLLPVKVEMKILNAKKLVCSQEFRLEVIL